MDIHTQLVMFTSVQFVIKNATTYIHTSKYNV